MKPWLLALLAAVPSVRAQTLTVGAADTAPTANPTTGSGGSCVPLRLPAEYRAKDPNGWFPQVSPTGRYVAHGFGKVSVIDLTTQSEKVLDPRHTFLVGWIRPGTISWVFNTGHHAAERYEADAPAFTPRKMPDDPSLVAGNKHAAADGHWASYIAGAGFRIAYDNKVVAMGAGGGVTVSQDWLAHAATNENQSIKVYRGGSLYRTYPAKTHMHELNINRGYVLYGGYGPIHGITPDGRDTDVSVYPKFEGVAQTFFVGQGASAKPWIASCAYDHASNKGWTVLRPWGQKAGAILADNASGMSVVDACGTIVVARNDDKGRLKIVTMPVPTQLLGLDDVAALQKRAALADGHILWTEPAFGAVGHGVVKLKGEADDEVSRVDILVNLKKVGTARLGGGVWSYDLDTSPYSGGINLSALGVLKDGKTSRDTIRFNVH